MNTASISNDGTSEEMPRSMSYNITLVFPDSYYIVMSVHVNTVKYIVYSSISSVQFMLYFIRDLSDYEVSNLTII